MNNTFYVKDYSNDTNIISYSSRCIHNVANKVFKKFFTFLGMWATIKNFLMLGNLDEDEMLLEETKKVPTFLNASIHHFSNIFGVRMNL